MKIFKLCSFWACLVYIAMWILHLIPVVGIILMFGMALSGPYLWGLIPHLITLALILDIQAKRLSQLFWIIPIVIYGSYYVFYIYEKVEIKIAENELRDNNPDYIIKYNPESHSLISNDAGLTGKQNKISVVYDESDYILEGFKSYRTASQDLCTKVKGLGLENLDTSGFMRMEFKSIHGRDYRFRPNACQIRSIEIPDKNLLKVLKEEENKYSRENKNKIIHTTTYHFYLNEQNLGNFRIASVNHLPIFPFVSGGCWLNSDAASWDCGLSFYRKRKELDVWPNSTNTHMYGRSPIAAMLQIEKYEEKDFSDFSDYPGTQRYIHSLSEAKKNEKPEDFNEWGIKKDSLTIPKISSKSGVSSYEGWISTGKAGNEFYMFIKNNIGKTVYINANVAPNVYTNADSIMISGLCLKDHDCKSRDHFFKIRGNGHAHYNYINSYGATNRKTRIEGYWNVGDEVIANPKFNSTRTELTGIPFKEMAE